jgi:hypothetical protein
MSRSSVALFLSILIILIPRAFYGFDTSDISYFILSQQVANQINLQIYHITQNWWLTNLIAGKIIFTYFPNYALIANGIIVSTLYATLGVIFKALFSQYFDKKYIFYIVLFFVFALNINYRQTSLPLILDYIRFPTFFITLSGIYGFLITKKYNIKTNVIYILLIFTTIQFRVTAIFLLVQYIAIFFILYYKKESKKNLQSYFLGGVFLLCLILVLRFYFSNYIQNISDADTFANLDKKNYLLQRYQQILNQLLYLPYFEIIHCFIPLGLIYFLSKQTFQRKSFIIINYIIALILLSYEMYLLFNIRNNYLITFILISYFLCLCLIFDIKNYKNYIIFIILLATSMASVGFGSDSGLLKFAASSFFLIPILGLFYKNQLINNKIFKIQFCLILFIIGIYYSLIFYQKLYREEDLINFSTKSINLNTKLNLPTVQSVFTTKQKSESINTLALILADHLKKGDVLFMYPFTSPGGIYSIYHIMDVRPLFFRHLFGNIQEIPKQEWCNKIQIGFHAKLTPWDLKPYYHRYSKTINIEEVRDNFFLHQCKMIIIFENAEFIIYKNDRTNFE